MTLAPRVSLRYPCLRLGALASLLLSSLAVSAAAGRAPDAGEPAAASAQVTAPTPFPVEQAKQCYNGCQRWGQMCNVDPRGVYKCQRRCEKFGEICE